MLELVQIGLFDFLRHCYKVAWESDALHFPLLLQERDVE